MMKKKKKRGWYLCVGWPMGSMCVVGFRMFQWGITSHDAHEGEIKGTGQLWSPRASLTRPTTLTQRQQRPTWRVSVGACGPTRHVSDDE